jgi:FkbM family methyltransferase
LLQRQFILKKYASLRRETMKNKTKYILQRILGFNNYLKIFSRFKIATLKNDKNEKDFFAFMDLLHNPTNILDLGANIGVMSVHLAERFPNATVHAVEPLQTNMDVLKYTIEKSKVQNVKTYQTALGDEVCTLQMVLPKDGETRLHGLSHVLHDSIEEWNEGDKFDVPCTTVDLLFGHLDVQGIKIDVENFEYFVLNGAKSLLKRSKPVVYAELWDNENRQKCFALMRELGYSIHCVIDGQVVNWNESITTQNFVFQVK